MSNVGIVLALSLLPGILVKVDLLPDPKLHPDTGLNVLEIIQKYGYPLEQHWVTTDDGYILGVHRIPHGRNNDKTAGVNKTAVLLVHGLLSSSADWVNMGPEKSMGFLLADMGYDVWLVNTRGNTWSRNHTTLDPDAADNLFWLFSWNEIGIYDLPATIDYITAATQQEKVFYIGHSQGTTTFYVMGAERPQYNAKIRLMVSLAPVAYMSNVNNSPLQFMGQVHHILEPLAKWIGLYEILPRKQLLVTLATFLCNDASVYQELCVAALPSGADVDLLNRTMLPVIFTNIPAGASIRQFFHYHQEVKSGFFRKYDHGFLNRIKYGLPSPPSYNLNKITAPVSLFYGEDDHFASVKDVERLRGQLPNVVLHHRVDHPKFRHVDFIWAKDVVPLLYNFVFRLMSEY